MTFYIGVDPGRTTGACWVSYREKQMILHDFEEIPWERFMQWVKDWPDKIGNYTSNSIPENVIVVCEDFIHRAPGPWTPSPVTKQIGVCYGKAFDKGWHFTLSQPMNKTAGYKMAKLRTKGHWEDSYAHVVFAIQRGVDPEQTIVW